MVQCEPVHTFKTMAEIHIFKATPISTNSETTLIVNTLPIDMKARILSPPEKDVDTLGESKLTSKILVCASDPCRTTEEISEQTRVEDQTLKSVDGAEVRSSTCKLGRNVDEADFRNTEDKENAAVPAAIVAQSR